MEITLEQEQKLIKLFHQETTSKQVMLQLIPELHTSHIILDTLQEMLPEGDPRKELVSENLITYVTDRKGHDRRYAIAPDKIKAEVGWYPETCFAEGIKKTIKWFFENEEWMKNVTSGDYQKYYQEMYK